MKIEISSIKTNSGKDTCFVHARGAFDKKGRFIITTQPLRLTGCDVFYRMHKIISEDGGKTWSSIVPCDKLDRRPFEERHRGGSRSGEGSKARKLRLLQRKR